MMFQDSVFMMPHLGVLSQVHSDAAWQVFDKDCLVRLGTTIAPRGAIEKNTDIVMEVSIEMPDGGTIEEVMRGGEIKHIVLPERKRAKTIIRPQKKFDIGNGNGKELETEIEGGVVGVFLDARGRPLILPDEFTERKQMLLKWIKALDLYPEWIFEETDD